MKQELKSFIEENGVDTEKPIPIDFDMETFNEERVKMLEEEKKENGESVLESINTFLTDQKKKKELDYFNKLDITK